MSRLWSLARSVTCPTSGQADRWFSLLLVSHVQLFVTPWTVACQAPPSMGSFRQECWSGLPFPSLGEFPQPRGRTHVSCIGRRIFYHEPPSKPRWFSTYRLPSSLWTTGVEVLMSFNLCFLCSWKTESVSCSVMSDSAIPWMVAHQAPLFMQFSRQEYWSGLPFLSPGDLPNSGNEPGSPALQADSLPYRIQNLLSHRS